MTDIECGRQIAAVPDPPPVSRILPDLFVGACPQTPGDVITLQRDFHITAVLNLQTADDRHLYRLDWNALLRAYQEAKLLLVEVPIEDKNEAALTRQLSQAVSALDDLLHHDYRVFVHCNIGNGRSPTVAAAWMHWRGGWELGEAIAQIRMRRRCQPNRWVIEAAQPLNEI